MPDGEQSSQFLEQIIETTLEALSENASFDEETLVRLRGLVASSDLTNYERIVEALGNGDGDSDEAA